MLCAYSKYISRFNQKRFTKSPGTYKRIQDIQGQSILFFMAGMPWRPNIREEDFLKQQHDITVDIDPVYLAINLEGKLRSSIEIFRYERVQSSTIDFRLGCIFYKSDEEVVRFVFSRQAPVVSINGTLFAATPNLLNLFAELLPHTAYEEVNHAAFKNWMIDCATLYNRTDINTIINKLPEDTNTN